METAGGLRRFALEVRFEPEPIEGRLHEAGGEIDRPFSGWLGLMAAIEAARVGASRVDDGEGRTDVVS